MFDKDVNTVNVGISQGSEYATDYEYIWVPNMAGFIIFWKRLVLEQATLFF